MIQLPVKMQIGPAAIVSPDGSGRIPMAWRIAADVLITTEREPELHGEWIRQLELSLGATERRRLGAKVVWTDDRVALVKRLYVDEGYSASQTAKMVGNCTRNAILGVAFRKGWPHRPPAAAGGTIRPKVTRETKRLTLVGDADDCATPLYDVSEACWQPLGGSSPRPWIARAFGECAWPVGGEGADTLSCCLPSPGTTYCREHAELATNTARRA